MQTKRLDFIFIIVSLLLTGCSVQPIESTDRQEEIIAVQAEHVKKNAFQTSIELTGRSHAVQIFPVMVPSPMKIDKVHVQLGQEVKQDDELLTFDQHQAKLQLEEATLQVQRLEQALVEMNKRQQQVQQQIQTTQSEQQQALERAQAVINGAQTGAVTMLDLLQASTELLIIQNQTQAPPQLGSTNAAQLELQLEQAKAQVRAAQRAHDELTITAPFDGTVTLMQAQNNQMAIPNSPLVQLSNLDQIKVDLQIGTTQIEQLQAGMDVSVTFEGDSSVHKAILSALSPGTGYQTNTYQGVVLLDNQDRRLFPGKLAHVEVITSTVKNAFLVPIESVFFQNNQAYVYCIEEEIAQLRPVSLGQRSKTDYHILDGLKEGEMVITSGRDRVTDGRRVYIQK